MKRIYLSYILLCFVFFVSGCAAIPYIGPIITRMGATELFTAGAFTVTIGDIAVYFIADNVLETIIEDKGAFCPSEFQNKSYCILIGTDGDRLTGNFYAQGNINQDLSLSIYTENNPITCQLPKGRNLKQKITCDTKNIQKLEDAKISVIENNSKFVISSTSLKEGLNLMKNSQILKNLKKGRKVFKVLK